MLLAYQAPWLHSYLYYSLGKIQCLQFLLCYSRRHLFGPRREKTCLRGFANNTGADQPAHTRSLISAFVIRFLESIICKLAINEILVF